MNTLLKKVLVSFAIVAMVVGVAACRHSETYFADHIAEHIADELSLDEQQIALLNTVKLDVLELRRTLKQERKTVQQDLAALVNQEQLPPTELSLFTSNFQQEFQRNIATVYPGLSAFHASLTSEQKQILIEYIQQHDCPFSDW